MPHEQHRPLPGGDMIWIARHVGGPGTWIDPGGNLSHSHGGNRVVGLPTVRLPEVSG